MAYTNPFDNSGQFGSWYSMLQQNGPSYQSYNQDPSSMYGAFSNIQSGGNNNSSYYDWLQNQYNRYYGQYNTLAATNPTLQWGDYLSTLDPSSDYSKDMNLWDRGEHPGWDAPTMRMVI